ncbi:hypothetical protein M3Y97_00995900 [Aphelenchoides bicaudatus]|nr:hypothetical protein M3Y97_00995900 [Aphelenchoides bicaudatus]
MMPGTTRRIRPKHRGPLSFSDSDDLKDVGRAAFEHIFGTHPDEAHQAELDHILLIAKDFKGTYDDRLQLMFNEIAHLYERGGYDSAGDFEECNICKKRRQIKLDQKKKGDYTKKEFTVIDKENSTIVKWKLVNIKDAFPTKKAMIYSPKFKVKNFEGTEFKLFLNTDVSVNDQKFLGLMTAKAVEDKPVNAKVTFWLEEEYGNRSNNSNSSERVMKQVGFMIESNLSGNIQNKITEANDNEESLFLCCELKCCPAVPDTNHNLGNKLWELYKQGIGYDTVIEAADREFKVMSAIFMSQSETFKKMLSGGEEKRIKIEDISLAGMEALVFWMYTGQLVNEKVVEDLFVVADQYNINDLKVKCGNIIINQLNEKNASERLALATEHKDKDMEGKVMKFIAGLDSEKIKNIFGSKAWFEHLSISDDVHVSWLNLELPNLKHPERIRS